MKELSKIKIDGTTYNLKDATARTEVGKKIENVKVNEVSIEQVNNSINITTFTEAEVYTLFEKD